MDKQMDGVREYSEEMDVFLREEDGRMIILAKNEGGYNCTKVDLLDVIEWVKKHMPELL